MLQADIKMLTGVCQAQTAAVPPPTPTVDLNAVRQQAELDAFNRETIKREQAAIEQSGSVITNLDFAATESNRSWIRYSWKATIHNSLNHTKTIRRAVGRRTPGSLRYVQPRCSIRTRTSNASSRQLATSTRLVRIASINPDAEATVSNLSARGGAYFRFSTTTRPAAFRYTRYLFPSLHDAA